MHAIIALYTRAYLTAVYLEAPPAEFNAGNLEADTGRTLPDKPENAGSIRRAARWLREAWQSVREDRGPAMAEEINWPRDL